MANSDYDSEESLYSDSELSDRAVHDFHQEILSRIKESPDDYRQIFAEYEENVIDAEDEYGKNILATFFDEIFDEDEEKYLPAILYLYLDRGLQPDYTEDYLKWAVHERIFRELIERPEEYEATLGKYQKKHIQLRDKYKRNFLHRLIEEGGVGGELMSCIFLHLIKRFELNINQSIIGASECQDLDEFDGGNGVGLLFGATPLLLCIYHGYGELLSLLLDNGADGKVRCCFGFSPIHYALICDSLGCLEIILSNPHRFKLNAVIVNTAFKSRDYFNHDESESEYSEEYSASHCLNRMQDFPYSDGIDLDSLVNGMNALHLALLLNSTDIFNRLLSFQQLQTMLTIVDSHGYTAIEKAFELAEDGDTQYFDHILIIPGLHLNAKFKSGYLLPQAVDNGHLDEQALSLLRKSYEQVQDISDNNQRLCNGIQARRLMLRVLVENDDCDAFIQYYNRMLGFETMVSDAHLDSVDDTNDTLIHLICRKRQVDALNHIVACIDRGDIDEGYLCRACDQEDVSGLTPIRYAIRTRSLALMKLLIPFTNLGAKLKNTGLKRYYGDNPEELKDYYPELLDQFPMSDIREMHVNCSSEVAGYYADQNDRREGSAILHEAVSSTPQILLAVLEGADINIEDRDLSSNFKAINISYNKLVKNRDLFKYAEEFKSRVQGMLRGDRNTKNLESYISKELKKLSQSELSCLKWLCDNYYLGRRLISLFVDFSIGPDSKRKLNSVGVDAFVNLVSQAFDASDDEVQSSDDAEENDQILRFSVINYFILLAAQKAKNDDYPSDGEDYDEEKTLTALVESEKVWLNTLRLPVEGVTEGNVVPIFRGINFIRGMFVRDEIWKYLNELGDMSFYPSVATFSMQKRQPYDLPATAPSLVKVGIEIRNLFVSMTDVDVTAKIFEGCDEVLRGCKTLRHLLQKIYTEDFSGFTHNIFERIFAFKGAVALQKRFPNFREEITRRIRDKFPNFDDVFENNCCVSGSLTPRHAVRYVLGVSRAEANRDLVLNPRYDLNGRPKYPIIGVVFIAMLTRAEFEALEDNLKLINVTREYAKLNIGGLVNGQALMPETEITFVGYMEHVLIGLPLSYPNCELENQGLVANALDLRGAAARLKSKGNLDLSDAQMKGYIEDIDYFFNSLRADGRKHGNISFIVLREALIPYYEEKLKRVAERLAAARGAKISLPMPDGSYCDGWRKESDFTSMVFNVRKENQERQRQLSTAGSSSSELFSSRKRRRSGSSSSSAESVYNSP